MAEQQSTSQTDNTSITITIGDDSENTSQQDIPRVRLKLKKPKCGKKVNWTEETVDNEHMDKKKSKCCCIYKKPRGPDEDSSSEEDDECENCKGHVEKKKIPQNSKPPPSESPAPNPPNQNLEDKKPEL